MAPIRNCDAIAGSGRATSRRGSALSLTKGRSEAPSPEDHHAMPNETLPTDPFPTPAETPVPPEQAPTEPTGIPQPGPDIIDPDVGPPIGIPPGAPPEIPTTPAVF